MPRAVDLTLQEREALKQLFFGNQVLLSAMHKVQQEEADYWHSMARSEAMKEQPQVARLVQYAAREAAAINFEIAMMRGAGIQKNQE